ncbi:MAG: ABC transporter substrate-binding protein [Propionibacteriaceae bacterium]|nr:ABC transporter substrate-binding protein [Propionibacteriaceae bacterium]
MSTWQGKPSRRAALVGACAVLGTLLACGQNVSTPSSSPSDGASPAGVSAVDLTGATVNLPSPASRIVAIPIPSASMLVAVAGSPDVIVGMHPGARTAIEKGFLGEVYPQLKEVPTNVTNSEFVPDVEAILATRPDLVVQWGDQGAGLIDPLKETGIPLAQLTYGSQEELEGAISMYGQLLGKEDRADAILKRMTDAKERLAAAPAADTLSVLYIRGGEDVFEAAGKGSYNAHAIQVAGGVNVADSIEGTNSTVNIEQVQAWDPDIILIGNFGPTKPEDLYQNPQLAGLKAVQNKRIYKVPLGGYRWDPPNQESHLMWEWLAGIIRQDGAPGLRERITTDLEFLYGTAPSAEQVDTILQVSLNAGSAGYDNFGA